MYSDPEELQKLIDDYFANCEERGKPYTMGGLALHLGMDRNTLLAYSKRDQFASTIKAARDTVNAYLEERLLAGGGNVAGPIFALKNNAGWVDRQEVREENDTRLTITWDQGGKSASKSD
jgi:hypothetical protein